MFDKTTGGITQRVGYPPAEYEMAPSTWIRQDTNRESYGLDARRPESIEIISILSPLSYQPNLHRMIGIYRIYRIPYPDFGVILRGGYLPCGRGNGPIELENAGYSLFGISYISIVIICFCEALYGIVYMGAINITWGMGGLIIIH